MKSLKAEKDIPKGSKIIQFSPFLDEEGLIRSKGRTGKNQLDFNAKHPILPHWKHHTIELSLRNEDKDNQHEGTEHVGNIVQQKMWILGKRLKINQEQVRYLQKGQSSNDSTSNGRSTRRAVRCLNSLYKCWS